MVAARRDAPCFRTLQAVAGGPAVRAWLAPLRPSLNLSVMLLFASVSFPEFEEAIWIFPLMIT